MRSISIGKNEQIQKCSDGSGVEQQYLPLELLFFHRGDEIKGLRYFYNFIIPWL